MDINSAVSAYYQIKNVGVKQSANMAMLKTTMNTEKQQMNDILRSLPSVQSHIGKNIDIKI